MLRALLFFLITFAAYGEPTKGVQVSLISGKKTISPSSPFTVGLHLKHEKGFHTYWKNPGIVGVPTSIKWTLPEGFRASEIKWPSPELTKMADYPCYGYERDVTLLTTIYPPAELPEGEITLKAEASWMACSNECYPDSKTLTLTFPNTKDDSAFISKDDFPKRTKDWRIKILSKANAPLIRLQLKAHQTSKPVHIFSRDGQISSERTQIFTNTEPGVWELSIARAEYSPKDKETLPLVLQAGEKFYLLSGRYPK